MQVECATTDSLNARHSAHLQRVSAQLSHHADNASSAASANGSSDANGDSSSAAVPPRKRARTDSGSNFGCSSAATTADNSAANSNAECHPPGNEDEPESDSPESFLQSVPLAVLQNVPGTVLPASSSSSSDTSPLLKTEPLHC
jgi:hypothetical protein